MLMTGVVDAGGGRRGARRNGSQQDDCEAYSAGRPSAPATLFDFVTSKMPQSSSLGISYRIIFQLQSRSVFQSST